MTVKETLWLQGDYDFMAILETNDEIAAALRAFTVTEMEKILEKVV